MEAQLKNMLNRIEKEVAGTAPPKADDRPEIIGRIELGPLELSVIVCALEVAIQEATRSIMSDDEQDAREAALRFGVEAMKLHLYFSESLQRMKK